MRKVIFLDVDGVINIPPYLSFNQQCLLYLYNIINATDADIVVSSSWRCGDLEKTKALLIENGFDKKYAERIIGETCRAYHFTKEKSYLSIVRGNEIKTWVDRHLAYPWHGAPELDDKYKEYNDDGSFKRMRSNVKGVDYQYLILDDDTDMLYDQRKNFIPIDGMKGITFRDSLKAVNILMAQKVCEAI